MSELDLNFKNALSSLRRAAAVGAIGVVGIGGASACEKQKTTPIPIVTSTEAGSQTFPWPYCDNELNHRRAAVGHTKNKREPIVLIDSFCSGRKDGRTSILRTEGKGNPAEASYKTGTRLGEVADGTKVVVECFEHEGQEIRGKEVSSNVWARIRFEAGTINTTPEGGTIQTNDSAKGLVPTAAIAYYFGDRDNVPKC